ncbi:LPXTG cell wall anchor domain-containing protein [Glycomyces sp. NPDC021274]|uniref:LPXTG cell wall anchor domain-containing protein n=1 Tax=Glycomyces sp. NPDC021274 TaxID=3155120 RepID=UPI0033EB59BA
MTLASPFKRGALRAGAVLAAAALGATAAIPAQAQPELELDGYAFPMEDAFYTGWTEDTKSQAGQFYASAYGDDETELGAVRVVFGLSDDLAGGLALATADEHCFAEGVTITCDFTDVTTYMDTTWVDFDLLVSETVQAYASVDWSVSVQPAAAEAPEVFGGTWEFEPAGEEYARYLVEGSVHEDVAPGTSVTPEVAFVNDNAGTYKDVYFYIGNDDPYLQTAAEYSNCGLIEWGGIMCVFEDLAPEPGVVYELSADTPLTVTLDANAPGPREYDAWYGVEAFDVWNRDEIENLDYFDADTALVFEATDRAEIEERPVTVTSSANAYNLAITANDIDAANGETDVVDITVVNSGPANAVAQPHPGSGEGSFLYAIQLPAGVAIDADIEENGYFVTEADNHCHLAAENEWIAEHDPALYHLDRVDVVCSIWEDIESGATLTLALPVKVTGAAGAVGTAVVLESAELWTDEQLAYWDLTTEDFPILDGDLGDNSDTFALKAGGSGRLPDTGTSLTVIGSAAAVALAAGAVVFVLMRRRKAAAEW